MAIRKSDSPFKFRIMDLDAALDYIQARGVFLHFSDETQDGIDIWSPQTPLPITLRRAVHKHRDVLIAMMNSSDVRTCPNRKLHKRYSRGRKTCGVCRRIAVN